MKANNHYQLALETNFKDPTGIQKLSQIACVAYLNDFESLDDNSLLSKLVTHENPAYLSEIVLFMWRLRKREKRSQQN